MEQRPLCFVEQPGLKCQAPPVRDSGSREDRPPRPEGRTGVSVCDGVRCRGAFRQGLTESDWICPHGLLTKVPMLRAGTRGVPQPGRSPCQAESQPVQG